ncbi:MAG: hypothetical protein GX625_19460 [Clostridiaceae bacterium]|nr:hypothetical protein [Clostridiaceae bacterium]
MNQNGIQVNIRFGKKKGDIFLRGTMFDGSRKLGFEESAERISCIKKEGAGEFLRQMNGFYSVVYSNGKSGWMAVDRIRSFPLFYSFFGGKLFISDDGAWVKKQVGDSEMGDLEKQEFLLTGFVTGADTIFPNVKQIQAGEVIFFKTDETGNLKLKSQRYYNYFHKKYYDENEDELIKKFDDVLIQVFKRLISFADGRTLVVPLSGGYDSRLIVFMLKKLGYENVISFSYGVAGNEEAAISRFIAEKIGIKWEFVPYSNSLWYEWYRSQKMGDYLDIPEGIASLPHLQDWPAVWILKKEKRIPDNSVFVPGIAADLNTGGFIEKYPKIYAKNANGQALLELILKYSFSLFPFENIPKHFQLKIKEKIISLKETEPYSKSMGESFECWVSTEKVAKFVLNSVRAYEFFGFEWWTPFWDKDFVDYWYNVPDDFRKDQKLYKSYIAKVTKELNVFNGIDPLFRDGKLSKKSSKFIGCQLQNRSSTMTCIKCLKSIVKKVLPATFKDRLKRFFLRKIKKADFSKHPLAWYGIYEEKLIADKIKIGASNINSILVFDHIKKRE